MANEKLWKVNVFGRAIPLTLTENDTSPIVHFKNLHEQNIEAFRHRLMSIAKNSQAGSLQSDDAAHNLLHDLLHRYCK
jgi:hypothetical protein